jgi:hypothetical protein
MKDFKEFRENKGPCWDGYVQVGTKMKNGKEVPNCVPKEEVEEALVAADMNILNAIIKKIKDDIMTEKLAGKFEKSWPKMQQLAKMAGYGITKQKQARDKTYLWKLKK